MFRTVVNLATFVILNTQKPTTSLAVYPGLVRTKFFGPANPQSKLHVFNGNKRFETHASITSFKINVYEILFKHTLTLKGI